MLQIGDRPADFTLTDDSGAQVRWADLRGAPVVIFAYPKADTPGCTREACSFRDLKAEFEAIGVRVLGISADKPAAQAKFRDKYHLTTPLLSDPDKQVLIPWGIWAEKQNYGKTYMGIVRTTVLFDADGAVAHVWSPVKVDGHVDAVLDRARVRAS